MKIGLAAAGSGGHVYPALAVAEALEDLGLARSDIVFFGGDRMEADTVPAAGYPFVQVDVHGIRRSLSFENLTLPVKIWKATRVIADTVTAEDIRAMVVFGGYVSGPAGLAARRRRIPLIVHEANAVPGIANRMVAPFAESVYVAFERAITKLRSAIVVGSPLRSTIENFDRDELAPRARERYGIHSGATVLGVIGGSLGAAVLNELATEIASDERRAFHILHLTGAAHHDAMAERAASDPLWTVVPFEDEMEYFYAASDVVLSRGGAITISELHATATPAVVVPLSAGKAYQALNACDLVEAGGVVVISEEDRGEIRDAAVELLANEARRREMSDAVRATRRTGVARMIGEHVMEVARD